MTQNKFFSKINISTILDGFFVVVSGFSFFSFSFSFSFSAFFFFLSFFVDFFPASSSRQQMHSTFKSHEMPNRHRQQTKNCTYNHAVRQLIVLATLAEGKMIQLWFCTGMLLWSRSRVFFPVPAPFPRVPLLILSRSLYLSTFLHHTKSTVVILMEFTWLTLHKR